MTTAPISPEISKETRALVRILDHRGITVVLDVGANVGQYAARLRQGGWGGRIVSFEPLPTARAALTQAAAADPLWQIAPPMALGASAGTVTLNVSAKSDMSSTLPFLPEMAELLDSAAYTGTVAAPLARLDEVFDQYAVNDDKVLLKIDTQGTEFGTGGGIRHSGPDPGHSARTLHRTGLPGRTGYLDMIAALKDLGFRTSALHSRLFQPPNRAPDLDGWHLPAR